MTKHQSLRATGSRSVEAPPAVKYRGIFINDEDWGIRPWVINTFDPETKNFGPKTYAKVFELMLRLRLDYIWPAMHPGSAEFSMFPGNAELADKWAIVTGSSHCEPMLRNNVWWPKSAGEWRYDTNRDASSTTGKKPRKNAARSKRYGRSAFAGFTTQACRAQKTKRARVALLDQIIVDQRSLIDKYVSKDHGPVAQCFYPVQGRCFRSTKWA